MARITVEDCLTKETNRFSLVQLAAKRTKQILHGSHTVLDEKCDNKAVVTSLREIAKGRVRFMTAAEAEEARLKAETEERERAAAAEVAPAASGIPTIEFDPSLIQRESLVEAGEGDDDEEDDEEEEVEAADDAEGEEESQDEGEAKKADDVEGEGLNGDRDKNGSGEGSF